MSLVLLGESLKPPAVDARELKLAFTSDKSPIAYKAGEDIHLAVTLDYGKQKEKMPRFYLQWTLAGDGGFFDTEMNEIAPDKVVSVKTKLSTPGFIRFTGKLIDEYGRSFAFIDGDTRVAVNLDCGVGVDVDKIDPSYNEPDDFRAFWKEARDMLDTVPVKATLKKMDETKFVPKKYQGLFTVYEVTVPCAGPRPVTGHLIMKRDAAPKSLPVQVSFDGYGPGGQGANPSAGWFYEVAKDKILFKINAHGYELGQEAAYYKKFFAERPNYAMIPKENADPKTAYFYGMALRVMRAFDFVKTLPEWDGKSLIAQGGSQGGLQATWAGSLVPELTLCRPHVTWCCDIAGTSVGRMGGWRPDFKPGLAYYDAVFHTRYIPKTCELDISRIGLGDYICPPSGLAAQYNAATCPKKAEWVQNSTHMTNPKNAIRVKVSAPAATKKPLESLKPIMGVLPSACKPEVKATFDPSAWTITKDGKTEKIAFSGRENIRKMKNCSEMDEVTLIGTLNAEADGFVRVGVGADWWWNLSVERNGKKDAVYGRTRVMPGGNCKATFEVTDWVMSVPVKKGENKIILDVILGGGGMVAMDICDAAVSVALEQIKQYHSLTAKFPQPPKEASFSFVANCKHGTHCRKCLSFASAQPYPAALEIKRKTDKDWQSFRSAAFATNHTVELSFDLIDADVRLAQYLFCGEWHCHRSPACKK